MAEKKQDQEPRVTLDGREVNQVRYDIKLDKDSIAPKVESADVRFFKGRREVGAFESLTGDELEKLVGPYNKVSMLNGAGASKRTDEVSKGRLSGEDLLPQQAVSNGLEHKAKQAKVEVSRPEIEATPSKQPEAAPAVSAAGTTKTQEAPVLPPTETILRLMEEARRREAADRHAAILKTYEDEREKLFRGERSTAPTLPEAAAKVDARIALEKELAQVPGTTATADAKAQAPAVAATDPTITQASAAQQSTVDAPIKTPVQGDALRELANRRSENLAAESVSAADLADWVKKDAAAVAAMTAADRELALRRMADTAQEHVAYGRELSKVPELADQVESAHARKIAELEAQPAPQRPATQNNTVSELVSRMEINIDGRRNGQFVAEWVDKDAQVVARLAEQNKQEERNFALLVMDSIAQKNKAYATELAYSRPDLAAEVQAAGRDETMKRALDDFEFDHLSKIDYGFELAKEHTTQTAQVQDVDQGEVNSIELDLEREQVVRPVMDDEVKRNVAMMWLGREEQAQRERESEAAERAAAQREEAAIAMRPRRQGGANEMDLDDALPDLSKDKAPVPKDIEDTYLRVGNRFHFTSKPDVQAFTDKGDKLETKSDSAQIANDLVRIAHLRGWEDIKVKGSEEFRRQVWMEASLQGMHVKGYKPSEADKALLEKRERENPVNAVEKGVVREKATTHQANAENAPQARQTSLDKDAARPAPQAQAASPVLGAGDDKKPAPLAGVLLEHGKANYKFDKDEKPNYYVKFRDDKNEERMVWGLDLERAVAESKAKVGQRIELEHVGRKSVEVNANVRDDQGKVVGSMPIIAQRNAWEVKADALRHQEPKEAVKAHPDLVNAYAIMRAAELMAQAKFNNQADRERFMGMAKESLAQKLERNVPLPNVGIREQRQAVEQKREMTHERGL
jgi:hypothetical protein